MQKSSVKIVRTRSNGILLIYHNENSSAIELKKYEFQRWSKPETIIQNVEPPFSLSVSEDDTLFLICRGREGAIYLCRGNRSLQWDKKALLKNQAEDSIFTKFHIEVQGNTLHLLYNTPEAGSQAHSLVYSCYKDHAWSNPVKIDNFIPFSQSPYLLSPIEDGHVILYYKISPSTVVCRELLLYPFTIGTQNHILQTSQALTDISILTTQEKIHMLCGTRGMLSGQLVYKNKRGTSISPPKVLWEGQRCESCILFQLEKSLWCMWVSGGVLYYTISHDGGNSFSHAQRYRGEFCTHPVKVEYINRGNSQGMQIAEVYTDPEHAYEILVLPDLHSGFYASASSRPADTPSGLTAASAPETPPEEIEKLKNKVASYEAQLKEATAQIARLSQQLAKRGEELSVQNALWNSRIQAIRQENEALTARISAQNAVQAIPEDIHPPGED